MAARFLAVRHQVYDLVGRGTHFEAFARAVAMLAGGTILAQGLALVLMPVLTRLYAPEEFGRLGIYTSLVGIGAAIASLKYEMAIISASDRAEASHLLFLSLALLMPISLVCGGISYMLIHASLLGFEQLPAYAPVLITLAIFLAGAFAILKSWSLRFERYRLVSGASIWQSAVRGGAQILFGVANFHWFGLAGGDVVGRGSGMSRMALTAGAEIRTLTGHLHARDIVAVMVSYRKFPVYALPSTLINSLALLLPVPLVAHYFDIESAGYYAVVANMLAVPLILVGTSIADAFHSRMSACVRDQPERALSFFFQVAAMLFLIGLVPILFIALMGEQIFGLIFGSQWSAAGRLPAAMAPWALAQFVVNPLARVVYVFQGQERKLIYDALSLINVVVVFQIGHTRDLSMLQTIAIVSVAQACIYGVYFLLLLAIVKRNMPMADESP